MIIIGLTGPSESGKTTFAKQINSQGLCVKATTITTRSPREDEKDGIDYHFYTKERFTKAIDNNELIEHTIFNGDYYGLPYTSLSQSIDTNYVVVLEPNGIKALREKYDNVYVVHFNIQNSNDTDRQARDKETDWSDINADFTVNSFEDINDKLIFWMIGLCG
jgi:guanylate kinase